jgi:hypothetical protein
MSKLAIISVISLLFCISTASSQSLVNLPLEDELYAEVYQFIDRAFAQKSVSRIFKNSLPYEKKEVARILTELDERVKNGEVKLSTIEAQKLKQFLKHFNVKPKDERYLIHARGEDIDFGVNFGLGESVISREKEGSRKTATATLFRPVFTGQIRDDFVFYSDLKIYLLSKTQFDDIPKREGLVATRLEETSSAGLANFYLKFDLPWFELFWGKESVHWGPGRGGALVLSENPIPINMVRLTASYHPVKYQAFTGILDSDITEQKYISSHRFEYQPFTNLQLGISETIVYSERFEARYLNPLQIYLISQVSDKFFNEELQRNADNALISLDFDLIPHKGIELYGELLIDDTQQFSSRPFEAFKNWGTKFGVLFGGYYVNPFSLQDTELRAEYAFVNQYTYTHHTLTNDYTHAGGLIGHRIGTDADDLWIQVRRYFSTNLTGTLEFEQERHGEGRYNKPHRLEEDATREDEWEFLSGVVESTRSIRLGALYSLINRYAIVVEFTQSWIRNDENQQGANRGANQVILSGQYRF